MGKKGAKQSAASKKPPAASAPKQPKQQNKRKNTSSYDSLRDPLDRELALIGLRVKQITADGNCFFRALSDQLEGNEGQHSVLRSQVVEFMKEHQEDFAPFIEDDQTFDAYMARIKKEGVWAGHMELQAASLVLKVNIHIYQAGQPRWAIMNFPPGNREVHLSYHDGEHYNSIRRADDYSQGLPVTISSSTLAAAAHTDNMQQGWSAADEAAVAAGTGCDNKVLIQQQLEAAGGNVDAAIEAVIEILAAETYVDQHQQQQTADALDSKRPAVEDITDIGGSQQQQQQQADIAQVDNPPSVPCKDVTASKAEGSCPTAADGADDAATSCNGDSTSNYNSTSSMDDAQGPAVALSNGVKVSEQRPDSAAQELNIQQQQKTAAVKRGVKLKSKAVAGKAKGKSLAAGDDDGRRPSRNKPCPCGSGRKHKNCCGVVRGGGGGATPAADSSNGKAGAAASGLPAQLATLHI